MTPAFAVAALYITIGAILTAVGDAHAGQAWGISGGIVLIFAALTQTISNAIERKTHGRHRKAAEAHRAGTGGSTRDGTRTGRGAYRGTGASMNPFTNPNYFARAAEELDNRQRAALGLPPKSATPTKPKARPAGDFDGTSAEFAAGVVTGTRSFAVDKLGRLTGVSYPAVWTPGENVAKCLEHGYVTFHLTVGGLPTGPSKVTVSARPPHSIAECQHGFYGYYEGSNDYYAEGRVMAVVEAYGETVIGTRGFRASKARIVALHLPAELSTSARVLVARNYAGTPLFESFEAMVAEFPPDDAGHGINPATDPDFWTREA